MSIEVVYLTAYFNTFTFPFFTFIRFRVSAGAEFPVVHHLLQQPAQRSQAELDLPHVQGRAGHELLQEPLHITGG